jgi:hypothetical protein
MMSPVANKKLLLNLDDVAKQALANAGLDSEGNVIIWDSEPVDIETFIKDEYYLNLKASVRKNVVDDCVAIFGRDPYRVAPLYNYALFSEAVGTGKTTRQGIMALYFAYKLLCLHDPIAYFNAIADQIEGQPRLAQGSRLAISLMSVSEENARKVIYSKIGSMVAGCKWFMEHYPPAEGIKVEKQFDPRPEDTRHLESRIYKNVYIIPGSSSEYAAVGFDLIMGVIDEATLFEEVQDKTLIGGADSNDQAEVVWATIDDRIFSRFGNQGLLIAAGNPMHTEDFLERHIHDSEGDPRTFIVRRRAYWHSTMPDFDPEVKKPNGDPRYPHFYFNLHSLQIVSEAHKNSADVICIPRGDGDGFYRKFKQQPERSKRSLAGYPTSAVGRVLASPTMVIDNVNKDRSDPIRMGLYPWPIKEYLSSDFKRVDLAWHAIHIDLGEVGDAAGLSMAHPQGLDDAGAAWLYTDLFLRFEGSPDNEIQQDHIYDWVIYLHDVLHFHIGHISMDRWQSSGLLQRFNLRGFRTSILSMDVITDPYDELIQSIRTQHNDYYRHQVAMNELANLERHKAKYDHGRRGSKDVSDAWAGAVYHANRLAAYPPPVDSWAVSGEEASRALVF